MARIVFFITILGLFLVGGSQHHVFAANSPYSVKGVEVDVLDESSVKARNRAFIEAQRKAFEVLATRYYAEGELKTLKIPSDDVLSGFIQDFKIASEQVSTKRYKGVFDFRFKAAAVNRHFGRGPINYADNPVGEVKKILLLPFYHEEGKEIIFNKSQNPFWGSLLIDSPNYKTVILPEGNIQDLTDIGNKDPKFLSPTIIRRLKARYDVNNIVIAIASVNLADQTTINIDMKDASNGLLISYMNFESEPTKIGGSTLSAAADITKPKNATPVVAEQVTILDKEGAITDVTQVNNQKGVLPESQINPEYFLTEAERRRLMIEARKKSAKDKMIEIAKKNEGFSEDEFSRTMQKGLDAAGIEEEQADQGEVNVQVFFNSMSEWIELQKQLSRLDGLRGIRIVTLKTNQGETVIEYSDWKKLLVSMKSLGFVLEPQSADSYVLKKLSGDF